MHKIQNRKIIAVFLAFVMLVPLLVVPASAADSGSISSGDQFSGGFTGGTFWDSAYSSMEMPGYGDEVLKALGKLTSSDACVSSDSGFHSGSAVSIEKPSGRSRYLVHCRCDSCGVGFTVGVTAGELNAAYNSYVSNLPATNLSSDGHFIIYIDGWTYVPSSHHTVVATKSEYPYYQFIHHTSGYDHETMRSRNISFPLTGQYRFVFPSLSTFSNAENSSYTKLFLYSYNPDLQSDTEVSYANYQHMRNAGETGAITRTFDAVSNTGFYYYVSLCYASSGYYKTTDVESHIAHARPYFEYLGALEGTDLEDTYVPDTRPAPLTGPVGYVDENGEKQVVENTQIVNEIDGIVYNPVTGNSITIDGWNYDYASRTYDGVTSDGMQWAVTYGDGDITLVEGDTVYNIYYLVQPPSADDCQHEYASAITREATCTMSGVETYTCSTCGDSYTKSIPATGHNWQVLQKVNTEYDETGNLVTQGYTIYQCSICGEQYKSTDGAAPPSGGSENTDSPSTIGGLFEKLLSGVGDVLGGFVKGILSLLTKAVDALAGIGELFAHFVENVVGLFGGFTDFLSAVFPFLPEEFFTIFSLGMILLVAAAVLRKFLN